MSARPDEDVKGNLGRGEVLEIAGHALYKAIEELRLAQVAFMAADAPRIAGGLGQIAAELIAHREAAARLARNEFQRAIEARLASRAASQEGNSC